MTWCSSGTAMPASSSPVSPTGGPSALPRSSIWTPCPCRMVPRSLMCRRASSESANAWRSSRGGDGWRWPVPDEDALASGAYGSTGGLEPADLRLIQSRATDQPYATFTSPLRLAGSSSDGLRRVAIFGADGGMSLTLLRDLIEQRDPRAAAFADADWELHEPTGRCSRSRTPSPSYYTGSPRPGASPKTRAGAGRDALSGRGVSRPVPHRRATGAS